MANCSQCGSAVTEGATFCPVCGTPTTVGETPAAAEATPPAGGFAASAPPGSSYSPPPGADSGFGTSVPSQTSAGTGSYKFNPQNLTQMDWIAAGATLVLFISLFLDWYHISFCSAIVVTDCSASADALTAHGYMYIVLLVSLVILGIFAAKAGFGRLPFSQLPLTEAQLVLVLGAVNLLFVIIAFFDKSGTSWSFGAFIGLLAALVALAPTIMPMVQKQMGSK